LQTILENSSDAVTVVDEDLVVTFGTSQRIGVSDFDGEPGANFLDNFDRTQHQRLMAVIENAKGQPGELFETEISHRAPMLDVQTLKISVVNLLHEPTVRGIVITTSDVTTRKALEQQLTHQSFYDGLTALPNRVLFTDRLTHALDRFKRDIDSPLAVLFIDLDDFKSINEGLGHTLGDQLLHGFARRLQGLLRPADTFARIGADEFAILMEDSSVDGAVTVAERVLQNLLTPFVVGDRELVINCSIGVATSETALGSDELQRNAEVAMYRAKAAGRGGFRVYEPEMHDEAVARLELESGLRRALDRNEFVLHYQPQIDFKTGAIIGVEALVRWEHPEIGLVPPDKFIPIAEETGLILGIGRWVLRQACSDAARWRSELGENAPYVSVNLSYRQLQHPDLLGEIARILFESGLPPSSLTLELTESVLVDDPMEAAARLEAIKELGVNLSIDDFGTGYSSLSYLRQFPFNELKIDRRFINAITFGNADSALVQAVLDLGKLFSMNTVAEGVETVEQRDKLIELGCSIGQGYLFSRPVPADRLDVLLREESAYLL
jgi:diguanylate cyclase (GGDEF)-like protein